MSSIDFRSRSGGIDGRPASLYIRSNTGESSLSASSASFLIFRIGWSFGTALSGETMQNIDGWCLGRPLMASESKHPEPPVHPFDPSLSERSERFGRGRRAEARSAEHDGGWAAAPLLAPSALSHHPARREPRRALTLLREVASAD